MPAPATLDVTMYRTDETHGGVPCSIYEVAVPPPSGSYLTGYPVQTPGMPRYLAYEASIAPTYTVPGHFHGSAQVVPAIVHLSSDDPIEVFSALRWSAVPGFPTYYANLFGGLLGVDPANADAIGQPRDYELGAAGHDVVGASVVYSDFAHPLGSIGQVTPGATPVGPAAIRVMPVKPAAHLLVADGAYRPISGFTDTGAPYFMTTPDWSKLDVARPGWVLGWTDPDNFVYYTPFEQGHAGRVVMVSSGAVVLDFPVPLMGAQAEFPDFDPTYSGGADTGPTYGNVGYQGLMAFDANGDYQLFTKLTGIALLGKDLWLWGECTPWVDWGAFQGDRYYAAVRIGLPSVPAGAFAGGLAGKQDLGRSYAGVASGTIATDVVTAIYVNDPLARGKGVGVAPPLRLKQRDDQYGLSGSARLPLRNTPTSIQGSPTPRVAGRSQYL